ncbi:transposase [Lentibacillus cibarius]|uniref:Transposase n=1 Tax=Lentibacillus cibarius TaxID=2583219 RepID=A0A549YFY3_9BACI|nr:transposase [Lentibacillus cibarius]TRM10791.1 transposase [Lentibacillus cibarius]TRM11461.1 transposase [Lentibacillus cibarius]
MFHSTTDVYQIKRKAVNFAKQIVSKTNQVETKFVTQVIYGIHKSGSVLLKDIADALNESVQVKNTIERLSRNLSRPLSSSVLDRYTQKMVKTLGKDPVIMVDDSDVIKPHGQAFEALGKVRDGSSKDNKMEKGYNVTEIVGLTVEQHQPVSLFSHIHSSWEKRYKSANDVLFRGLRHVISHLTQTATFVFDRGYDMNALFDFMHQSKQNYIVRLTEKRNIFWKGKWFKSRVLRDSRKGKIKTTLTFREDGKTQQKTVYISHLNVTITASKRPIRLVLVYGLGEQPMMLATNKPIRGKQDAIDIVRDYMSRWRIEEYFRFKKQHFGFEDFRVRSLTSMNNLNQLLTYAMGMLGLVTEQSDTSQLYHRLIHNARALRREVGFHYYQLAKGIVKTLAHARTGIRDWIPIRKTGPRQLALNLAC